MVIFNHIPSSNKRPTPLQPEDYDHEIFLIDHSAPPGSSGRSRTRSFSNPPAAPPTTSSPDTLPRRNSTEQLARKRTQLKNELAKRRYAKYQDRRDVPDSLSLQRSASVRHTITVEPATPIEANGEEETRGRPVSSATAKTRRSKPPPEYAIDVLYENQRGGFLCGIPLFSSKALGAADTTPWTNINLKPILTDITNAQPPDPSWEWAWKEWQINHDDGVDEDGWEYSFMFSSKFSWHGPKWYSSYVRRRAWIRKRVKKDTGYKAMEAHMLNSDYFTIHPNQARNRSISGSRSSSVMESRYSVNALAKKEREEALDIEDIRDIGHLMKSLKYCRIDREKTEAVESFVEHGGDDLYYLKERMHDIMSSFIFQASRKYLLAHLSHKFDEAVAQEKANGGKDAEGNVSQGSRVRFLKDGIKAADEEVKRLEFWSDIKQMAEEGETKGAVDEKKGWGREWRGLDVSGPRDVISEREMPGFGDGDQEEYGRKENGKVEKGKGKSDT